MPSVRLSRVDFRFGSYDILCNLNLVFAAGWTGLVGPNGAGKSTLLRLVAGSLEPNAGHIEREHLAVHYCPQRVQALGELTQAFGRSWDRHAIRLRDELALEVEGLQRWPSLSPGERKRWKVGAALFADSDILLLDEPTNHLDLPSIERLQDALANYRGALIMVSHDDAFADALTTERWHIEGGEILKCAVKSP